ncbi:hypothetical protein ACFOZ7_03875 [Natribaculum luteum]|uniref:MYXO-CTERM domain-containing protein n=1 Tax=Natribaculum luteum TaxID=1586232 RepID=A0ABD5NVZ3_9EURY|nr:hypothetical protein [Natribaculum luteum]
MPDTDQPDENLSERVVKEAVGIGMESPMRESILEAVEEADGSRPARKRQLPLLGAVLGLGAAVGYLIGSRGEQIVESDELSIEEFETPTVIDGPEETDESTEAESTGESTETDDETEAESGGSRLRRILLALGILAGIALLRRRFSSSEQEEWEPIEEFEPAVSTDEETEEAGEETPEQESEAGAGEEFTDEEEETTEE